MIWSFGHFGHFGHFGRSASVAAYWGAAQGSMDQAAEHSDDRPVAQSTLVDSVDFVFSRSKQIWGPCTTAWVIGSVLSWAKMVKAKQNDPFAGAKSELVEDCSYL